ncbi:phosphotransferase [bacterium]|nr:phosphotransferase [candidate division CSSED10-310 bacterium]
MLPLIRSIEEYRKIYADSAAWLPAARLIASRHNLPESPERQPLGTHLVFRSGNETTIKIFCPLWPQDYPAEKTALTHIRNLPVPSVINSGEIDGWPYLVMKCLPGVPAVTVWPTLPMATKRTVVRQIGQWMRALHRTPLPVEMDDRWDTFIGERVERAEAHHAMPEPWLSWIRDQLHNFSEPPMNHVLMHADITADHILLTKNSLKAGWSDNDDTGIDTVEWRATGLIDFGDARVGHPLYEFVAPLAFYTFGEPELASVLIDAYGLEPSPDVFRILTQYCLLHEFGTIRSFLSTYTARDPEDFVRMLWGEAGPDLPHC